MVEDDAPQVNGLYHLHMLIPQVAQLGSLFLPDANGRRPLSGPANCSKPTPDWKDLVIFPEYLHGDNGAGLGAWQQTGWTALVADLILSAYDGAAGGASAGKAGPTR